MKRPIRTANIDTVAQLISVAIASAESGDALFNERMAIDLNAFVAYADHLESENAELLEALAKQSNARQRRDADRWRRLADWQARWERVDGTEGVSHFNLYDQYGEIIDQPGSLEELVSALPASPYHSDAGR